MSDHASATGSDSVPAPPVTLITGCSSGFGLAAAVAFAGLGHQVVATMRDLDRAGALRRAAADAGVTVEVMALDVCSSASVDAAVSETIERFGTPDIVVNNAGVEMRGAVHLLSDDEVWSQLDTNVVGVVRLVRAVVPSMIERGSGCIVNVGSLAGRVGTPYAGIYAASKHAIEGLSEAMHFELAHHGIRVALVQPGRFGTALGDNAQVAAAMGADTPEFARAAAFREALSGLAAQDQDGGAGADPALAVAAIVEAATTDQPKLRWPVGADAELVLSVKDTMVFEEFESLMRTTLDWRD